MSLMLCFLVGLLVGIGCSMALDWADRNEPSA